jgi:Leucine-rich repeat (LRR) protein
MMKKLLLSWAIFTVVFAEAQTHPWESVAPPESPIFTDIKDATRSTGSAYRMELTGPQIFQDRKQVARFPELKSLMALRLVDNNLTRLPSPMLSLNALVYFSSNGNPLTELSDSLGMWGNLKFIEFYKTSFDTLPEGLFGLPRLTSFTIGANTDTLCFSSALKYWAKNLTEFRIYNTVLDTIPPEFSTLNKLQKVVLYKCRLDSIPKVIYPLGQLSELWLDSNNISVVPRDIASMQGLTYLSLRGNRITKLPSTLCFMKNLVVLDIRNNPIEEYEVRIAEAMLPNCRVLSDHK